MQAKTEQTKRAITEPTLRTPIQTTENINYKSVLWGFGCSLFFSSLFLLFCSSSAHLVYFFIFPVVFFFLFHSLFFHILPPFICSLCNVIIHPLNRIFVGVVVWKIFFTIEGHAIQPYFHYFHFSFQFCRWWLWWRLSKKLDKPDSIHRPNISLLEPL